MRTLSLRLPDGERLHEHRHAWHQLVYATEGTMTVATAPGSWVVPPERAVWIPAGFEHALKMTGTVRMRTVYVRPDVVADPPPCCAINVSPLLRELVLEVVRIGMLSNAVPAHGRLALTLLDQIAETPVAPLEVCLPTDPRALRVAERALQDLARVPPLDGLVAGSGASVRTVERLFRRETGMTFGRWLQRAKALHALERLAAGESVTSAGLAVGFDSTSAFIVMFRRVLGCTPGRYFGRLRTIVHSDG